MSNVHKKIIKFFEGFYWDKEEALKAVREEYEGQEENFEFVKALAQGDYPQDDYEYYEGVDDCFRDNDYYKWCFFYDDENEMGNPSKGWKDLNIKKKTEREFRRKLGVKKKEFGEWMEKWYQFLREKEIEEMETTSEFEDS